MRRLSIVLGLQTLVCACVANEEPDVDDDTLKFGQCLTPAVAPAPSDPDSNDYGYVAYAMVGPFAGPTTDGALDSTLLLTSNKANTKILISPARDGSASETFTLGAAGERLEIGNYNQLTGVAIHSDAPIVGTTTFFNQRTPSTAVDPTRHDWLRDAYAFASGNGDSGANAAMPLMISSLQTATGRGDTDLFIQNTHDQSQTVHITAAKDGGGTSSTCVVLAAGQAVRVPGTDIVGGGAWFGSVEVRGELGPVLAVANVYTDTGGDVASLQTYRAFPESMASPKWIVPLMASRLSNDFNTPISVQNRSGGQLSAGSITMRCVPGEGSANGETFTVSNASAVQDKASVFFNPVNVTHPDGQPFLNHENFFGTCVVKATNGSKDANIVVMPQARWVSQAGHGDAGAFQAYPIDNASDATTVVVPWVVQSPGSEYRDKAAVTIVNLTERTLHGVEACYKPGNHCKKFNLAPNGQEIENGQYGPDHPNGMDGVTLTNDRVYTLVLSSPEGPIGAFNQIKRYDDPHDFQDDKKGDSFIAYNGLSTDDAIRTVRAPDIKATQHIETFEVQPMCDTQMAPHGWLCDNSPGGLQTKTALNGLRSSANPSPPTSFSGSGWSDWVASKEYRGYAHVPKWELWCDAAGVAGYSGTAGEFSYGYTRGPGGIWFADPDVYVGPDPANPQPGFNHFSETISEDGQCLTKRSQRASRIAHAERVVVHTTLGYDQPYVWHNLYVQACCDGSVQVTGNHSQFPDARLYVDDGQVDAGSGEDLGFFMRVAGPEWSPEGYGVLAPGSSGKLEWSR